MRNKLNRYLVLLLLCAAVLTALMAMGKPGVGAYAKDGTFKFSKTKYTLYEGNIISLNLIKDGTENYQDDNDFWMQGGYFSTSDRNVVRVDYYGNITCVGTGSAEVTAKLGDKTAKCTVKVKKSKMKLSSDEETVYSYQEIVIKASGIKNIVSDYADSPERIDVDENADYLDYPSIWSDNKGNFHVIAGKKGEYRLRFSVTNKKGVTYSKSFLLHTVEAGPERREFCVAVGGEVELEMLNSDILSMELVRYTNNESYWDDMESGQECPIETDFAGGFTAVAEGSATYDMKYLVDDGVVIETNIIVHGYRTDYIPFNEYLWVGSKYIPQFENKEYYSVIRCTSSDTEVLDISANGSIVPMKGGKAVLKIYIDGLEFTENIEVIDLNIKDNNVMTWPGQKFSFKVSNLPKGAKVKYSSSNEEVATISKKGVMKATSTGFTVITVSINNNAHNFNVNVGEEISVKAVLNAASVVGTAIYSQDRRMEEGYYDCSSLTWRSYAKAGLKIKDDEYAPTAADLAKYMADQGYVLEYGNIAVEDMRPGDFLFYAGSSDNGRFMKINHVAMYYATYSYEDEWGYGFGSESDVYGVLVEAGSGGVHFSTLWGDDGAVMVARWKYDDKK